MAEQWTLDRMEKLLEELEPADIRAQYGEELKAHPRCLAMLTHFESLDEQLEQLKQATPPAPAPAARINAEPLRLPRVTPMPRSRNFVRIATWALPLAAVLLLSLLVVTRSHEPSLEGTHFAELKKVPLLPDRPQQASESALEYAEQASQAAAPLEDSEKQGAGPVAQSSSEFRMDAAPLKKVAAPTRQESIQKSLPLDKALIQDQEVRPAFTKGAPPEPTSTQAAAPMVEAQTAEKMDRPRGRRVSAIQQVPASNKPDEADAQPKTGLDDAALQEEALASEPMDLAADRKDATNALVRWLGLYEQGRHSFTAEPDPTLFAPGAPIQWPSRSRIKGASLWPELRILKLEDKGGALMGAYDENGKFLGQLRLTLDERGRCTKLVVD